MKKTLVVGASGATGQLLVNELLQQGGSVTAIIRHSASLPASLLEHPNLKIVEASISEMKDSELGACLQGCDAVLSCLGHNLTFKGMFGEPRRLVADTVKKVARVVQSLSPNTKLRYILMNTSGNVNRDTAERPPFSQRLVVGLVRLLLPAHVDNEQAADYLRVEIGQQHPLIEWAAVRPDSLTDEAAVTEYDVYSSPTRNAIFDAGPTSRINVANFMARLASDDALWKLWRGQMPVIYNRL